MLELFIIALLLLPALALCVIAMSTSQRHGLNGACKFLMLGGLAMFIAGVFGVMVVLPLMVLSGALLDVQARVVMFTVPGVFLGWSLVGLVSVFSGVVVKYAHS